jgi:two-component system response regulator RpfG
VEDAAQAGEETFLAGEPKGASPVLTIFAARIRAALDARGIAGTAEGRATALSIRLGRSVSTATRWLNGEMLPGLETLLQIATTYDISLDYLLGLSEEDHGLEAHSKVARTEAPRDPQPILVVDDQPTARAILNEIAMAADQYATPVVFGGAPEALKWASSHHADLVITDYRLPGTDGLEFVRNLRRLSHFADIPVLMVTIVEDLDLRYRALRQGINDFLVKPIDAHEGIARCKNLLAMSRQQALLRDRSSLLAGLVEQRAGRAKQNERRCLMLLAQIVEWRNGADANHAERVSVVSGVLASALGIAREQVEAIELGAALHDVGMIAVPEELIARIENEEGASCERYRAHTTLGYRLLKTNPSEPLHTAALIALGHHEWFNGAGYPTGLRGDHIPLAARIVAVADRLDTLWITSTFPDLDQVWADLRAEKGLRLDPEIVDAAIEERDRIQAIWDRLGRNAPPTLPRQ